uniref:Glycosyltransferase 2-like domain-containing protein n=1 Tax=Guillardia theta TaxID=55529 RepID=A0A7S4JPY1_GUITH|mmetsp:Transcript_1791/g.5447  ORF Transcript_1791/g.5447 Transcript_1791/m.5447 type:complete len:893 (+) Transcript_1791:233-2911(+)
MEMVKVLRILLALFLVLVSMRTMLVDIPSTSISKDALPTSQRFFFRSRAGQLLDSIRRLTSDSAPSDISREVLAFDSTYPSYPLPSDPQESACLLAPDASALMRECGRFSSLRGCVMDIAAAMRTRLGNVTVIVVTFTSFSAGDSKLLSQHGILVPSNSSQHTISSSPAVLLHVCSRAGKVVHCLGRGAEGREDVGGAESYERFAKERRAVAVGSLALQDKCTEETRRWAETNDTYVDSLANILHVTGEKMCALVRCRPDGPTSLLPVKRKGRRRRKVVVINLPRRADKRALMRYKLEKYGIKAYEFFDAVECRQHAACQTFYHSLLKVLKPRIPGPNFPSWGAVGLLWTQSSLFEKLVTEDFDELLLFEDDIYMLDHAHKLLELSSQHNFYEDAPMVFLGANQLHWSKRQLEEIRKRRRPSSSSSSCYFTSTMEWDSSLRRFVPYENVTEYDHTYYTYGTYAMLVRRPMLEFLLRWTRWTLAHPSNIIPSDALLNWLFVCQGLRIPVVFPNLVLPEVRDSDNMGPLDLLKFAAPRRLNYSAVKDLHVFENFARVAGRMMRATYTAIWDEREVHHSVLVKDKEQAELVLNFTSYFVIIITGYNFQDEIEKALSSVCSQNFPFLRLIYFDDGSTDRTLNVTRTYLRKHPACGFKATILISPQRRGQSFARQAAVRHVLDHEVVVFVDGDDWLMDNSSILYLNEVFHTPELWPRSARTNQLLPPLMTYGNVVQFRYGKLMSRTMTTEVFPEKVKLASSYRSHKWISHHPRVALGWLAKSVPDTAVMDWSCRWLTRCSDMAQSFFMLEHADGRMVRANRTLYVYNFDNSRKSPDSYFLTWKNKTFKKEYEQVEAWVRGKYKPASGKSILDHVARPDACDLSEARSHHSMVRRVPV